MLYNELLWDGKPSRKNRIGKDVTREERDRIQIFALGFFLLLPCVVMISIISFITVKPEDINADLFDLEMLQRGDENYGKNHPFIALSVFVLLLIKSARDLLVIFKKTGKKDLPEPDD